MICQTILTLLFSLIALLFCGCNEESTPVQEASITSLTAVQRVPGEVQVLNGCGIPGVAEKMRQHLVKQGFDVVESDNAKDWNYKKTLVAIRTPGWEGARRLGEALQTDQIVVLLNERTQADATVFVGDDYQEILANASSSTFR